MPSTTTTTTQNPVASMLTSPKKTVTEEGSVEERDLKDIVAGDRYVKQSEAQDSPFFGMKIVKMKPPGTI